MVKKIEVVLVVAAAGALVLMSATSAGGSAPGSGQSASTAGATAKSADSHFVMDAAAGGMAEVEMGRLAADKATSPDVKEFGQKMVDDHSKANDELKQIASQKGITLPSAMNAREKAKMDKMSKLSGGAFDKAYMADMVEDHKKDVAEFQKEAASGKDPDVKAFASKTLPTLQEHLKMAQDVHGKLNGKAPSAKAGGQ